ncbi:MAG TPA: Hsp20/alpha crystallin family protein [Vicinamibacterales bacterium]|nr:Hsp20/alpha crystallin family protein [Vicinamibacterales bacterium]
MAFARWDPLRDLLAIQHRLERLSSSGQQGWAPAVDLCETADAFIVTAELPGLSRDSVRIDVQDGRITLQGRRDARVPCEQYHQVERGHGEFSRSFALPRAVETEAIAADLRDGVLTIVIPKTADQAPRRVDVG